MKATYDWPSHDLLPESLVRCGCGERYRTHTMIDLRLVARKPCPRCTSDHPREVVEEPEAPKRRGKAA